ncbi:MAG: class I SAM-dependent methyltransferase, partial [Gammaproteobacteria bacterium]|nr:class I SAM-dependent methyltransferase [Gammaproteobacteria bacterium]
MSRNKKEKHKKHKKQRSGPGRAETADKHALYESSVQNVEHETEFVANLFKEIRGRAAHAIREDFCGTAHCATAWVALDAKNTAIGVDLDADVLAWGREHHLAKLTAEQQSRVTLLNENVLTAKTAPVDVVLAMNFSYWIFKQRAELVEYFSKVRAALKDDGVFFLDAFGGYEAYQ